MGYHAQMLNQNPIITTKRLNWRFFMPTKRPMLQTIQEFISHIPEGSAQDTIIKASGLLGGSTLVSGFMLDPTWVTAAGQFMGGLAALITICYTIYRGKKGGK